MIADAEPEVGGKRKRRTISEDLLAETKERRPSISDTVCSYQLSDNVGLWHRRSTKKVDPSTKKVDPPTKKVDPSTKKVDPPTKKVDPSTKKLDPSTKKVDPSTKKVDPSTKRLDPSTKRLDPSTKKLDPSTKKLDPSATSHVHCTARESPSLKNSPTLPKEQRKVRKLNNDRRSVFTSNSQRSKDSRNRRATQAKARNGVASNGRKRTDSLPQSKVRLKLAVKSELSDSGDGEESLVSDDDGSTSGSSDDDSRKAQRNRSNKKQNSKVQGES